MDSRPVLYLDLDDTVISWEGGSPHAALGAGEFVRWALAHFEVRWLTTWCPGGEMDEKLLTDLGKMLSLPVDELREIRGGEWDREGSKLNGVAWLEHVVLGRSFVWLEDDYGFKEREREFLVANRLVDCYRHCNVTVDPACLTRVHAELRRWLQEMEEAAA
jgi:hypothetical protein